MSLGRASRRVAATVAVPAAADPLLFSFTSGATSRPQLVEHSQVSYPVEHLPTAYWLGLRAGDRHLNISSPGGGKHAWSFFAPWIAGSTALVYNYRRFDPARLLEVLREQEVNTLCAPPTVWRMLVSTALGERPPALRELIGAGEPLNPEAISAIQDAWGLAVRDGYGQTETTAQASNVPAVPVKPRSMGLPLQGVPVVAGRWSLVAGRRSTRRRGGRGGALPRPRAASARLDDAVP